MCNAVVDHPGRHFQRQAALSGSDCKIINITRMLISIVSRPFMNDINSIIDHILFTNQLGDTKLQSKYCEFK